MDLVKFFNDVARIADALEALLENKRNGKVVLPTKQDMTFGEICEKSMKPEIKIVATPEVVDPGIGLDEINSEVESHVEEPTAKQKIESEADDRLRREFLKSELRRLGVAHAAAARTKTLEALYQEALAKPVVVETKPAPTPVVEKDEEPVATIEQARAGLVAYTAKHGKDKAVELLQKLGGADRLSAVPPEKFGAIVRACREGLL